ncbi:MAG: FUSC family protein [Candidatus Cohnella colombiensis]|uniref:FUSC family protein n=1 Tax=Candidatus Cohnella colombiensis TaxID=3121368 RepID=A0AA95EWU8_9BACL|nr:MAG: FUSC family protein [Cohnella sp.]
MSPTKQRKSGGAGDTKINMLHKMFVQAFKLKDIPFPYLKAFRAGLAASLPVFIGLILNHFEYGLLASLGGFTYLYVFNQPYAQRAKRIFFVMLGLTSSVVLGTVMAPYPLGAAFVMGLIGALPIFIFGALRITGPSAIFFILIYAMTTGMPVDPSLAPLRGGLVLLGGALSWIISMLGWFANPHGPEIKAVKNVYFELAQVLNSVGTEKFNTARHRTVLALKDAEDILVAGYSTIAKANTLKRLILLNEQANSIFLESLELAFKGKANLPKGLKQSVRALALAIGDKKKNNVTIPHQEQMDKEVESLYMKIDNAYAVWNESVDQIQREVQISKPPLKTQILATFDKDSVVFLTAIRSGVFILIAAIIAISFDFNRSYWIPLSCAAVMAGSTFVGTFHRAIQRTFGTILGILIASLILTYVHNGYLIILVILGLTFLTEIFIVKNYGFAAMFFTPAALVMAEYSTGIFDFHYFATVRITDILVGSMIGLIGTIVIGRRLASSLMNRFIAKTIRSQGQFLLMLFSENNNKITLDKCRERSKMQTNLSNLLTVYNTSLGELHSNKNRIESMWPIIFSIEQMGYYLDASLKYYKRPVLSEADLSQLFYIFETMAIAVDYNSPLKIKNIPEIKGFSKIRHEILVLQEALNLRGNLHQTL